MRRALFGIRITGGADFPEAVFEGLVAASQLDWNRQAARQIVLIGDTEHDLRCGRGIGARAVGVCTGRFTRAHLEVHTPHLLLDDLSDPAPLLALLKG